MINKIDLAPYVGADLELMMKEALEVREGRPVITTNCATGQGIDQVVASTNARCTFYPQDLARSWPRTEASLRLISAETLPARRSSQSNMPIIPYHICKAQYLDEQPSGMATLYIQSCSGGLFEDDRLSFTIHAAEGTAVHLTSPGIHDRAQRPRPGLCQAAGADRRPIWGIRRVSARS